MARGAGLLEVYGLEMKNLPSSHCNEMHPCDQCANIGPVFVK